MAEDQDPQQIEATPVIRSARDLATHFEKHRRRLMAMVEVRLDPRLQGRLDASDILQDAFVDLNKQLDRYLANPELPSYLWMRLVTNQRLAQVHREHLGTAKRDASREVAFGVYADVPAASSFAMANFLAAQDTSAGGRAARNEMRDKVLKLLNDLDAKDREIIALRNFEELSTAEIALILRITKSGVSRRYIRAVKRFKEVLSQVPDMFD